MVICLERGAGRLHMVQLMLLHSNPDFLIAAYPGCHGKEAIKRV